MREMTMEEMGGVEGGGFWSGFGCGVGLVGGFVLMVSPDPFSKVALLSYAAIFGRCATAF